MMMMMMLMMMMMMMVVVVVVCGWFVGGLWVVCGWSVGGSVAVNHLCSGLDSALLPNFLFLINKVFKNHKIWKTAQNQTSQTTTHHMIAILLGEQQFFNIAECKRAEKPKIEKKVVHPHLAA